MTPPVAPVSGLPICLWVLVFHSRIVLSWLAADASTLPSGLNATLRAAPVSGAPICLWVRVSQNRTVFSPEDASVWPTGLNATP